MYLTYWLMFAVFLTLLGKWRTPAKFVDSFRCR